jgi:plastocyanin
MRTARSAAALLALALSAAACGGGGDGQAAADRLATGGDTTEAPPGDDASGVDGSEAVAVLDGAVTIVAENGSFNPTELSARVGEAIEITFDNRDSGLRHNLHVRDAAGGDQMTNIAAGPDTQTLTVTFDQAGEYDYLCDVHPELNGTITVE